MSLLKNKRAMMLGIIVILVIVLFFFAWLINFSGRECSSNNDCSENSYCGSDFACHQIPTIETVTVKNNLLAPSLIIGLAIVGAAYILRSRRKPQKKQAIEEDEEYPTIPIK